MLTVQSTYKPMVFTNEKPDRLTIIDPNRPENNVSGGTRLISDIFETFSRAHRSLLERLEAHENGDTATSFLRDLVGANFGAYSEQRAQLRELYFGLTGIEIVDDSPEAANVSARNTKAFRPLSLRNRPGFQ
jgi:DNA polymerase sigma